MENGEQELYIPAMSCQAYVNEDNKLTIEYEVATDSSCRMDCNTETQYETSSEQDDEDGQSKLSVVRDFVSVYMYM